MTSIAEPVIVKIDEPIKAEIVEVVERLIKMTTLTNSRAIGDAWKAECAAQFLLAWSNSNRYGGFDPACLGGVGQSAARDFFRVMEFIAISGSHPVDLGLGERIREIGERLGK